MTLYRSTNERAIIASAEFHDATGTGFFVVPHEADVEAARQALTQAGQAVLTQTHVKGKTMLVTRSPGGSAEALKAVEATTGGGFAPAQPEKPTSLQFLRKNGWKIRGGSSVIGQSMTLFSAFKSVSAADANAGRLQPKFDPAIGAFATLNLAANCVNYIFGGQKEEDRAGLEKFDRIIADEVKRYQPDTSCEPGANGKRKLAYMSEQERAEHEAGGGVMGMLKNNSVRLGEVGLRTLGSLCMMFNYREAVPGLKQLAKGNLKQAFLTAKVKDPNTFLAGCGMVAGKAMGLAAQTYDPNNPPTTYVDEIRQKVLWTTSSFTEMVAQSFVAVDRARNKRLVLNGQAHPDYTGVAGNILLTVPPYPTRLVLPYGEKVLDCKEIQARLLDELPKLPQEKIPEVAARITARMVEHMRDKSPRFSQLYCDVVQKLQEFHKVDVVKAAPALPAFAHRVERKPPDAVRRPAGEAIRQILSKEERGDISHGLGVAG